MTWIKTWGLKTQTPCSTSNCTNFWLFLINRLLTISNLVLLCLDLGTGIVIWCLFSLFLLDVNSITAYECLVWGRCGDAMERSRSFSWELGEWWMNLAQPFCIQIREAMSKGWLRGLEKEVLILELTGNKKESDLSDNQWWRKMM